MSINKDSSLKSSIYNITPFTTTDYEGHLSCILWFIKCNMRCLYCYNNDIVLSNNGNIKEDSVFSFLEKRVGKLDAVVLSGGEATVHDLIPLCKKIKKLGYKIKLDTNGINFNKIKKLIDLNLLDYIALDFKALEKNYKKITKVEEFHNFEKTLKFLIKKSIKFEVRTTVNADLLTTNDINSMIKYLEDLKYNNIYYIQLFLQTKTNLGSIGEINYFNKEEIKSSSLKVILRD